MKLACLIRPTDSVIQRQHLFTVYVHPSKSFEGAADRLEGLWIDNQCCTPNLWQSKQTFSLILHQALDHTAVELHDALLGLMISLVTRMCWCT